MAIEIHGTQSFQSNTLASKYCTNTAKCIVVLHNTFKAYGHWLPRYYHVNQFHHRGNPATGHSIPAVLPQVSPAKPRYYRRPHYRAGLYKIGCGGMDVVLQKEDDCWKTYWLQSEGCNIYRQTKEIVERGCGEWLSDSTNQGGCCGLVNRRN